MFREPPGGFKPGDASCQTCKGRGFTFPGPELIMAWGYAPDEPIVCSCTLKVQPKTGSSEAPVS